MDNDEVELDVPGQMEQQTHVTMMLNDYNKYWLDVVREVRNSGTFNFKVAKVNVNTNWNVQLLRSLLTDYYDAGIVDFLQYRFPINRADVPLELGDRNHKGATLYPDQVDKYIAKELKLGAMVGPFEKIPFEGEEPVAISPLSTRKKKDSSDRCIIIDCSWPLGFSLNDGIDKDHYLGDKISLKYPTVDTLARHVFELMNKFPEELIFFWKEDLDRAFHQIRADPFSVPLLGYR